MAKWEIHKRFGFIEGLWWKLVPGTTVTVKWPVGWAVLHDDGQGGQVATESADPNDHYRPWLEKYVGKQGWDWQWRMGSFVADNGQGTRGVDSLKIKFRKGKSKYATIAAMRWS